MNINHYHGDMIKVRNVRVYGLAESVMASSYPMSTDIPSMTFRELTEKDEARAEKLGEVAAGTGHDCYLKGIVVQADFSFPQYIWQQAKRYHWFDFVSSQSTMHKIIKMDIEGGCNPYVDKRVIAVVEEYIALYNESKDPKAKIEYFHYIVANIPSGFILTARITTNYLQLKTMYNQRKHHKMKDWKEFCQFCDSLPSFLEYTQSVQDMIDDMSEG